MRTPLLLLFSLLIVNAGLFVATDRLEARALESLRTCAVQTSTGICRCHHTIVSECDPGGDIPSQCKVQCGLAID